MNPAMSMMTLSFVLSRLGMLLMCTSESGQVSG